MSNPNLNNRMSSGYRGGGSDPRLSQRPLPSVRPVPRPNNNNNTNNNNIQMNNLGRPPRSTPSMQRPPPPLSQQQPQQRYSMQRPPPPPNHNFNNNNNNNSNSSFTQMYPGRPSPQRPIMSNQNNNMYRMRPPNSAMQQQTGPYRRVSMNRSRSLSRPERQRPRQGMFRSPSQQQQLMMMNGGHRPLPPGPPGRPLPPGGRGRGRPLQQPIPNQLQQQLHQQKLQKQAMISQTSNPQRKELPPVEEEKIKVLTSWWAWTAYLMTCCIPNWFLKVCLRKKHPMVQQAWREKLSLVYIIFLLCCALAFVTYGLNRTLCPTSGTNTPYSIIVNGKRVPAYNSNVRVFGQFYPMDVMKNFFAQHSMNFTNDYENTDISSIFNGDINNDCAVFDRASSNPTSTLKTCALVNPYGGGLAAPNNTCLSLAQLQNFYKSKMGILGFSWVDLNINSPSGHGLTLVGDSVLNLTTYLNGGVTYFGTQVDNAIRSNLARDLSYALLYTPAGRQARKCMVARYKVGIMETETGGCIANQMIMTIILVVIIAMIVIRYSMALMFQWIIAGRLVKPGGRSNWLAWRSIKGGNNDPANHIPGPYNNYGQAAVLGNSNASIGSTSSSNRINGTSSSVQTDIVKTELYTVMLVTCYSEGEEGLRITMDSLAKTTYSKKHKIFFVVCDGMITGAGETRSTPDIVVDMMDLDPTMTNPKPSTYLAIADGERQLNKARVFAGHYRGVPCITIVKSGTEEEENTPKPGNRGKRDSQLILMSFFQRVLFNDRLSELDYEIFWKMTWLMRGVTPDKFETVLMVDADTKVLPDALTYMVAAMANDITIMGLCGETRIANKTSSWVTTIQVFEYYISHHYAKAFESLFGIVTCLPGCFSMYRIKTPKNGAWVPILANPDIILEYNQNVVTTLHEKNLLLLGEDRFLSTLMLRTFPRRQMMFVPQAKCKTVVPDNFKVLLSQRRRWINSTVHNLMELVLVSDLCGIACLSMQFSVFIDLIGTLVLPAAIVMTVYLIVNTAISTNPQWQSLALLIAILGLPAVLISITTFKYVYIMWMLVYLIALPIWNLVLPLYSFWHFDDFSWGATRVVAGEKKKDKGHLDGEGKFDPSRLVMKKWEDWESERTGQRFNNVNGNNKKTLKTPAMMDGVGNESKASINNTSSGSFGTMFNDRKMFGASP